MTSSTHTTSPAHGPAHAPVGSWPFDTVLIANRGEIACRVIRSVHALGLRAVAVHSDADAGARHVLEADVAVRIGGDAPTESYLSIPAIVEACRRTGAGAVHPGYGFLSENAAFAEALDAAGIVFIGPSVHALDIMGDKIRSKNHVGGFDVPLVPGVAEPGLTDAALLAAADDVGFPLLIKPSAGGGGKGMHAVHRAEDLTDALATARRVAARAFGDDTLFLERLVERPRHIEVQVLADRHGNVIHLGERECSLQRRHQKVIEEAPSSLLDEATRRRIGEAACSAARSVDYTGAGTVEFLVSDAAPDEFFFMEMNTRLQVEHPVTELVTGVDLVAWQIRIAAGEELSLTQDDVVLTGHAVEARVYAENPEAGFLPSTGTVLALTEPAGDGVRVDSSLLPRGTVSSSYDPMLAKVIAWGPDRRQALDRLDAALADTVVLGVDTNIEYLRLLVTDDDVRAGRLDTTMIERKLPGLAFRRATAEDLALAAVLLAGSDPAVAGGSPWHRRDGFRLGTARPRSMVLETRGATETVLLQPVGGTWEATVGTSVVSVVVHPSGAVTIDGIRSRHSVAVDGDTVWLGDAGWSARVRRLTRRDLLENSLSRISREEGAADPLVRSPMPGTVVSVAVEDGAVVHAGDVLLAVEAMKMEHQLTAAVSGVVHLSLKPGDLVRAQQVVATIETSTSETSTSGTSTIDTKVPPTEQPASPADHPPEGNAA
ncbi:biotin carboxylase N-terminal domain-containing protein [Arthrobacter agilis]|uniref:acetyl/propionyl/methylcrotonyl-CoA carboxylase subunit alpha n=1 Tax=Arthrobacter agilis TaxID=37921 RepID=UPI0023653773|nr:biotin carboxylase N-terminal domain-containing protein [Arthrobacter agilis]WDF34375.1 biotin carboxylase N-terminal domain-containing protein [Arthrobacter agilis]